MSYEPVRTRPISLIIRNMNIKNKVIYTYIPTGITKIKSHIMEVLVKMKSNWNAHALRVGVHKRYR
jgi:hypothetical protein